MKEALEELYKSRTEVVSKIINSNVEYDMYEVRMKGLKEQLANLDSLIEKHIKAFGN